MEKKKIVIVGGVAVGATAAARLRRISEQFEIVLLERGEYISFANCGLPYHIGGVIEDRNKLLVQTVEGMKQRFNLDIRNLSEVLGINRSAKEVSIKDLRNGNVYVESYDYLILSPGAKPIVPPIPGLKEANNVFTLRNIPDTDRINAFITENKPQRAVVIGGGFIGVEMAENLVERGLQVELVEMQSQVMPVFDKEMAQFIHQRLQKGGVQLHLNAGLTEIKSQGAELVLSNNNILHTDMVILAIGVVAENQLAKQAGLQVGQTGGIVVNDQLLTDDPHIFAAGDAIEVMSYISGKPAKIPLAWPANRQARLIADIISGMDKRYPGTLGTSVLKVFDTIAAATGANERMLQQIGMSNYHAIHIHPNNHASYYPGASAITMKLLFDKETGKVLGAQAIGKDGTEKRIDVIATAIKAGFTVMDLQELELAYAPPFSSAKDPVNMLGYLGEHVLDGVVKVAHWNEVDQLQAEGVQVLDVRTEKEFARGHIEGAQLLPIDEIRDRLDELNPDQPYLINCAVGIRAYNSYKILKNNGFKQLFLLSGGYKLYEVAQGDFAYTQESILI